MSIVDVAAEEGRWCFYDSHIEKRLDMARSGEFVYYDHLQGRGEGDYIHGEYMLQPGATDCRYHVVEHAHPSWIAPNAYAFVISIGICEADLPVYDQQRVFMLESFKEVE